MRSTWVWASSTHNKGQKIFTEKTVTVQCTSISRIRKYFVREVKTTNLKEDVKKMVKFRKISYVRGREGESVNFF